MKHVFLSLFICICLICLSMISVTQYGVLKFQCIISYKYKKSKKLFSNDKKNKNYLAVSFQFEKNQSIDWLYLCIWPNNKMHSIHNRTYKLQMILSFMLLMLISAGASISHLNVTERRYLHHMQLSQRYNYFFETLLGQSDKATQDLKRLDQTLYSSPQDLF